MDYEDFDLTVGESSDGITFPITVRSPEGEAHEMMRFPFSGSDLHYRLKDIETEILRSDALQNPRRELMTPMKHPAHDFGKTLFDALFTGTIRLAYDRCLARSRRQGIRIRLCVESATLAGLPWEFLFDPSRDDFVCLFKNTPLVRYPELLQSIEPLSVTLPLQILAMVASPSDLQGLDVQREKQRMEDALARLTQDGIVHLTWLTGQSYRELRHAMQSGIWHVFHFIGHGGFDERAQEGVIALVDEVTGFTHRLTATSLARALGDNPSLRLVVLNACEGARSSEQDLFSSTATTLVRRGIPAVVAMQYEISDSAAIEFSRTFYTSIADGQSVDLAVWEARVQMSAVPDSIEWATPVLYMRSPDGVLFTIPKRETVPVLTGATVLSAGRNPPGGAALKVSAYPTVSPLVTSSEVVAPPATGASGPSGPPASVPQRGAVVIAYGGHSNTIASAAWSPNGQWVATGSYDNTAKVWEADTGKVLRTFGGHTSAVCAIAWSPDSKYLASASNDRTVQVWNSQTGEVVTTYRGHSSGFPLTGVQTVAWSPDGQWIASGSTDNTAQVWEALTGRCILTYRGHTNNVYAVAWSPDSKRIASGSDDNTVQVWDASTGNTLVTYKGHRGVSSGVDTLAWSPDGQQIASGGSSSIDKTVQVWEADTGRIIHTYKGHSSGISAVAWSPNGRWIASETYRHALHIWNAVTGEVIVTCKGHKGFFEALNQGYRSPLTWSPDSTRIAALDGDNELVARWVG